MYMAAFWQRATAMKGLSDDIAAGVPSEFKIERMSAPT